jgi:tetratricopeptide (TPR) repeat protein
MVLLLHDRWGSPPSDTGEYTSGTEEEYNVARGCANDKNKPMRNIAVLFKGVEARQLSDPGDQLKKVLAFRERLGREKNLLYKTVDSAAEFEVELRGLLLKWLREHGQDGNAEPISVPPPNEPPSPEGDSGALGDADEDLLVRAEKLADEGQLTRAESLYATAVAARTDLKAMTQYIRFLRRTGRLDLAHAMSERLLTVASQQKDSQAVIEALSNLGIIYRKKGEHDRSTDAFENAVAVARDAGPDAKNDLAFLLDNLGLTLRKQGRFDEALERHLEALQIKRGLDDKKSLAITLQHAGSILREKGRFDEALELAKEAVATFQELEYPRGEAQARAILGEVYAELDELDSAKVEFQKSLELNEQLNSPDGVGMNLWQLGRVALEKGDLDEAEHRAHAATRYAGDERSRPEALGAPMQLLGNVEMERKNFESAIDDLSYAVDLNERNELGEAWSFADLARAHAGAGDMDRAHWALLQAQERGQALSSKRFQAALERAQTAVAEALDKN